MATRKTKFHGPTTKTVAQNVRRLREGQGLSAAKLSARTAELGYDIPREGIQKIEAAADERPGARHVNADELMVLSIALGVNPSALLLPPTLAGYAEITGRGEFPADYAWLWADGQRPLSLDPDDTEIAAFIAHARPRGTRAGTLAQHGEVADRLNRTRAQLLGPERLDEDARVRPGYMQAPENEQESPPDGADT
ncbi:helix-turn-helix domain-containing protein [Streptomonospora sp. PA3]|uniref:helix-turn-helix domain-containing protein n=1 Tax=Streptomonospora sp. PA3 TaxID=2607326 RepID=UPI001642DA58|nr:helix-turn-helix transcriptional regulator [Streptomonospora sp. PA3]